MRKFKKCISVGSKWSKDVRFTNSTIDAVRPDKDPYDKAYHQETDVPSKVTVFKNYLYEYFLERVVSDITFFTESAYIAINDAIYYDGVMKALLAFPVLGR